MGTAAAPALLTFAGGGSNEIAVGFPTGGPKAKLYVEYLRLPSWRAQSGTAILQTFRVAVHDPSTESSNPSVLPSMPALSVDKGSAVPKCLTCIGMDRYMGQGAAWAASDSGVALQTPSYRECTWSGVTAAQIPSRKELY